jgi:hypothetical protein
MWITRFVIPVLFCDIPNVQSVYWSDTELYLLVEYKVFFYISYNYMFRRLIMTIFSLYMKYLLSR